MARNLMANHTDMEDTIFMLFKANIVAAVGRQHKRGAVVSFVLALNRVSVVAVTTILVLHVGVIGLPVPCHYAFMFPRRAYHARVRARVVWGTLSPRRAIRGEPLRAGWGWRAPQ